MSWAEYVKRHAGDDINRVVADKSGVTEPTVSRWKNGGQGINAAAAAAFARAYGRPVLEAFIAAGFLTADEAKVRPAAAPDYSQLSNDELLELVRSRMQEGGGAHADRAAPNTPPDSGPGSVVRNLPTAASKTPTTPSVNKRRQRQDAAAEASQDDGDFEPR